MAAQTPVPGCSYHPGMGFVYVCKTCQNELICMDCVVSRHNSHNIGKLTDYVAEQKQQIRQYEEKLSKTDIPKFEGDIRENEKHFKESSEGLRKMIGEIKRQGEQIKTETDHLVDKLVTLCRDLEKLNSDITEKNTAVLTKLLGEKLKPELERCHQVLTSGANVDVISVAMETRNTSTVPPDVRPLKTGAYQPGVISNDLLERMLGTVLVDGNNPLYQPIPSTTVVSSFTTSFTYDCCQTFQGSGGEAWLSYWKDDKIYRVDQKGNIKEKKEYKVKVRVITISPTTGNIWFCVQEDKGIREVTSNGDVVTRFTVDSIPGGLCITQEGFIVVGKFETGIVMYTSDGQAVSDGEGRVCRQEAVWPTKLTYCRQTGDTAAADSDNVWFDNYMAGKVPGKEPKVIVMDKYLKLKFQCKYVGDIKPQPGGGQQSKLYPGDVCFDSTGDLLVVDWVTKSVMLIDGTNGHFHRIVYTSSGSDPLCVGIEDHTLWIGHRNLEMKTIKYK